MGKVVLARGNNPIKYVDPDGRDINKAIEILKTSNNLSENTKNELTSGMIKGIYSAEHTRMSFLERIGIDGSSIGRGQVTEVAYQDVLNQFKSEFDEYLDEMNLTSVANFKKDMKNIDIEDFIVTAYLALNIERRQKEGRNASDAAKFGIGIYHGAWETITKAQERAGGDGLSFSGTASELSQGTEKEKDVLKYINEVYNAQ